MSVTGPPAVESSVKARRTLRVGLSLRAAWLDEIIARDLDVVELVADAWMFADPNALHRLERLRSEVPFVLHCLGLNLGSVDGLDPEYVDRVKALADRFDVAAVSDHFAWRSIEGVWSSAFLPLPLRAEVIEHVAARVHAVQERLGRVLALETPSEYLQVSDPGTTVADALEALHTLCGSEALVDVCNLRVSAFNVGADPWGLARQLAPITRYAHVAGFTRGPSLWIDDHGSRPERETLALLSVLDVPAVLEWDRNPPSYSDVMRTVHEMRKPTDGAGFERATGGSRRGPSVPVHFASLADWQRAFMSEVRQPKSPDFDVYYRDQVFAAVDVLEAHFPVTSEVLGRNFRYFVREMVGTQLSRDVHGLSWVAAFAVFLGGRPELDTHPNRTQLEAEWHLVSGRFGDSEVRRRS